MSSIKLIIAAHKLCDLPVDKMYLPVHVGKSVHPDVYLPGFQSDNEGDNISLKNPYYCELTAIYWAWKNLVADYIGLVHYRRYFSNSSKKDIQKVLSSQEAEKLCNEYDLILPKKRNLLIETVYSHYDHTFDGKHFDDVRKIIENRCPEYLSYFDKHMKERKEHLFNMFIMKKELFHKYCEWMFPILEELETMYDLKNMDPFQARLIGRVSERLLDVWVEKNKIKFTEVGCAYFGKNQYLKKITGALMAKFFKKKYTKSF
ncbi:MAG: DUF4422 domain-containing protein [Bacteroidales bacterium]|nr:DUF4422 domain-containing protein [Candidatus Physcocola equi]